MIEHFQFRAFIEADSSVHCNVKWIRGFGEIMDDARTKELMTQLEHMGKWESLVQLLHDLNIRTEKPLTSNFGRRLYDIYPNLDGSTGTSNLTFILTKEEALLRTKGEHDTQALEVNEIKAQIANLNKWRNFASLVKFSREN